MLGQNFRKKCRLPTLNLERIGESAYTQKTIIYKTITPQLIYALIKLLDNYIFP